MWEKEFFAVIWSVKNFRPYLTSHHFTIRSDNKPTTQLLSNMNIKLTTTTSNRVARWINTLQVYNYTLQHHPGKNNVVADALSRFPLISNNSDNSISPLSKPISTISHHITAQIIQPPTLHPSSTNTPSTTTPHPHSTLFHVFTSAYQTNPNL